MTRPAENAAGKRGLGRRQLPRIARARAIWLYVIVLSGAAAGTFVAFVHGTTALVEPHVAWWLLAPLFLVAEACVVHLQFRRSGHSFSLADIPFVFGLLFGGGDAFGAAALLGTGVVWGARRLPMVKLAFNLVQLLLAA